MADQQAPQRDEDVVTYEAFRGLRNDVSPERFEQGDLAVADNIDLDKSGRIARRAGYTSKVAGAAHSLWADDMQDVCMFVQGGVLRRLATDYTSSAVLALANASDPMSYHRVSDRVYFSNGQDIGAYENGRARSWGIPVPALPGVAVTVGDMPAGEYQFAMTLLRGDGQESGAPLAGRITLPAGSGITFTTPTTLPDGVVGKILYVSPPNGEVLMEATKLIPSEANVTVGDPSLLSLPLVTQFLAPPPAGQLIAYYRGRMFVAVGDTLYMSEPYGYELFDLRRYIQLDGRITLLAPMVDKDTTGTGLGSGFFVGTDRSCGILAGNNSEDFQYVPKIEYGAIPGAVDFVDGALFRSGETTARVLPMWLTTQGLCIGLPDLTIGNLTRSKYGFPAAGRGAALFMPGPNRFIATANL